MIKTKEFNNISNTSTCSGCGNAVGRFTKIDAENPIDAQITYLTLCPTCRTTLIDKLAISPKPFEFEHVRLVLERELVILKADLKSIGESWEKIYGAPVTIERVTEEKTSILSMGYLHNLASIKECERTLEAIKVN
ncbi:MAG: hypothetical protein KAS66_16115 [Candidatus Omnitrophica bacterium]|nr:hypothetical protein [Candidatus Omnitrophota bacterium]